MPFYQEYENGKPIGEKYSTEKKEFLSETYEGGFKGNQRHGFGKSVQYDSEDPQNRKMII